MKVLILLLVLASRRGMPLGKNGASFQRKEEQWGRDNDLPSLLAPKHFRNERKAPLTFEHLSAENEASLTFNHFSDKNDPPNVFLLKTRLQFRCCKKETYAFGEVSETIAATTISKFQFASQVRIVPDRFDVENFIESG